MEKEQNDLEIWSVRQEQLFYAECQGEGFSAGACAAGWQAAIDEEKMEEIKGLVKFDWMLFPTEPETTSSDFLSITPQVTVLNASAACCY